MGESVRELPAIDAGVVPTQFVSGILPPRVEDGAVYQTSVAKALALVATALLLPAMDS